MAAAENQKLKILYLAQILNEETDENHPMPMSRIIQLLADNGIKAERKSLYSDMEVLRLAGMDIEMTPGRIPGYYIASRDFELPELKLLVDSVQASKFITRKKSEKLIKKLEKLTGKYSAQQLNRQMYVSGGIKAMNESIYYNVDAIHTAIGMNRKITFRYFKYNAERKREYRHEGKLYEISPYALCWDDENYYLIAFDSDAGIIKHYRVDKMEKIVISECERDGADVFKNLDMSLYTQKLFGMFGGEAVSVKMRFSNSMADVVIDRFGTDIMLIPESTGYFTITVPVTVSPQFYGWVFGLGDSVEIISPASVVDGMKETLEKTSKLYT